MGEKKTQFERIYEYIDTWGQGSLAIIKPY